MYMPFDHGNESCKTKHFVYTSGIDVRDTKPPMASSVMEYEGKFYSLTDHRLKYMWDKTITNDFFALTLHGIAKELQLQPSYPPNVIQRIQLAVGLPPSHYGTLYQRFEQYFLNKGPAINFAVNGKQYCIEITDAMAFPQGYAAAMTIYNQLPEDGDVVVIDIGGITTDILVLRNRDPDLDSSVSLEYGMVKLHQKIISRVSGEFGISIQKQDINKILLRQGSHQLDPLIIDIIHVCTHEFIEELVGELRERGIDLRITKAIFVGGGSISLEQFISQSSLIRDMIVLHNLKANVDGFEILYELSKRAV